MHYIYKIYNVLVGCYIALCYNTLKWEPLDSDGLMRRSFFASIRYVLQTTNEPSDVTYNVLVGYYIALCYNTLKGEPLDSDGLITHSCECYVCHQDY